MNNRGAAWFVAVVFILFGCWLTWEGWQKKWNLKGVSFRVGGIVSLVVGGYGALMAKRP